MSEFYFYSTPLHEAIFSNNEKEVESLLEKNSDIYAKDDENITCYELALDKNNKNIIEMIEKNLKTKNDKS